MKPWGWIAVVGIAVALLTLGGIGLGRLVLPETGAPDPGVDAERGGPVALDPQAPSGGVEPQTLDGNGVSIRVAPLELGPGNATVTFDVALNTHSVDLAYDLAELATLRLSDGTEVAASGWTGASGGHHVSGQLTFPALDLEGVQSVELLLREVAEVPVWTFTWDVP